MLYIVNEDIVRSATYMRQMDVINDNSFQDCNLKGFSFFYKKLKPVADFQSGAQNITQNIGNCHWLEINMFM